MVLTDVGVVGGGEVRVALSCPAVERPSFGQLLLAAASLDLFPRSTRGIPVHHAVHTGHIGMRCSAAARMHARVPACASFVAQTTLDNVAFD